MQRSPGTLSHREKINRCPLLNFRHVISGSTVNGFMACSSKSIVRRLQHWSQSSNAGERREPVGIYNAVLVDVDPDKAVAFCRNLWGLVLQDNKRLAWKRLLHVCTCVWPAPLLAKMHICISSFTRLIFCLSHRRAITGFPQHMLQVHNSSICLIPRHCMASATTAASIQSKIYSWHRHTSDHTLTDAQWTANFLYIRKTQLPTDSKKRSPSQWVSCFQLRVPLIPCFVL